MEMYSEKNTEMTYLSFLRLRSVLWELQVETIRTIYYESVYEQWIKSHTTWQQTAEWHQLRQLSLQQELVKYKHTRNSRRRSNRTIVYTYFFLSFFAPKNRP